MKRKTQYFHYPINNLLPEQICESDALFNQFKPGFPPFLGRGCCVVRCYDLLFISNYFMFC